MNIKPLFIASAIGLLATSAWAQSTLAQSTSKPLNLKLPADLPAASSTAAAPASSSTASTTAAATGVKPGPNGSNTIHPPATRTANVPPISTTPGVYYGDTSGRLGDTDTADSQRCDDSKFDKAQVHGSVSTGIASGSRMGTSSYEGGEINVTKAFGDCDHPAGGVSFSIGVSQSNFGGGRYRGGY
jgi:hypothetical protein